MWDVGCRQWAVGASLTIRGGITAPPRSRTRRSPDALSDVAGAQASREPVWAIGAVRSLSDEKVCLDVEVLGIVSDF